jgi:hypothetical protein
MRIAFDRIAVHRYDTVRYGTIGAILRRRPEVPCRVGRYPALERYWYRHRLYGRTGPTAEVGPRRSIEELGCRCGRITRP